MTGTNKRPAGGRRDGTRLCLHVWFAGVPCKSTRGAWHWCGTGQASGETKRQRNGSVVRGKANMDAGEGACHTYQLRIMRSGFGAFSPLLREQIRGCQGLSFKREWDCEVLTSELCRVASGFEPRNVPEALRPLLGLRPRQGREARKTYSQASRRRT